MATTGMADVGRRPPGAPPRHLPPQPRSDTDVPDLEASGENLRVINTNPEGTPMEVDNVLDKDLIWVTKLDLDVSNNTRAHHTNEFDITDPLVYQGREDLVVRRGQQFNISVQFNRPYDPNKDDLKLVFQLGGSPRTSKGTKVNLILSDRDVPNEWGAFIKSTEGNTLRLALMTPPTCGVGQWSLIIDVVKQDDKKVTVYRYTHRSPVYILFNPWCKDDLVYMREEHLLKEYILNETGKIYSGSWNSISPKPWSFGQFEGNVLDCVMYLLEKSRIPDHERGNPIIVSRKMSKIVNVQNDGGVLVGNWSGDYEGGTSPLDWLGSVPILEEYFQTKEPVCFGQCWVFSGVLTTVCRALGIPARSVTNFASAHDTDGSITIDCHFDNFGNPLEELNGDSVWNFHVWNDVWMARPDLPPGYGGWQAVDATPQETSDGYFQTGPASLLAVKRGEVSLSYDGPFVFAEVNADYIYWLKQADGVMKRLSVVSGKVGRRISTKRAFGRASWLEMIEGGDPDREDVTHLYKFSENSDEERAAIHRANLHSKRKNIYDTKEHDVTFELHANKSVFMGDKVTFGLKITNTSTETRTVHGSVALKSAYYTGITYKLVTRESVDYTILNANEEKTIEMGVEVGDYLGKLTDHCILMIHCMCIVDETKQTFTEIDDLRLHKPHLTIKAPDQAKVGEKFEVEVSFVNPLPVPLTKCELRVDGPGLQKPVVYKQPDVGVKQTYTGKFEMTPVKPGERELIVYFNCAEISAVTVSRAITVNKK